MFQSTKIQIHTLSCQSNDVAHVDNLFCYISLVRLMFAVSSCINYISPRAVWMEVSQKYDGLYRVCLRGFSEFVVGLNVWQR